MGEDARGGEAEDGEEGVRLLDEGEGRAWRQEHLEELPRVGGGARVEGGGAPGGGRRRRRARFELHGDGGAGNRE